MEGLRIPTRSRSSSERSKASFLLHFLRIRTVSLSCLPILTEGFRQLRESWKIIAAFCPGTGLCPQTVILSELTAASSPRSPITAFIAVLFPEPDSPTSPTTSPCSTLRLILFMTSEAPFSVRYFTLRFCTSSTLILICFLSCQPSFVPPHSPPCSEQGASRREQEADISSDTDKASSGFLPPG